MGFAVCTTERNIEAGRGEPSNMPHLAFEIDPNLDRSPDSSASLVFVPYDSEPEAWTFIEATSPKAGYWRLIGGDETGERCAFSVERCTLEQVQEVLEDGGEATLITDSVQVTIGPDFAFSGAVDQLVINDRMYDFEPFGVFVD